jgi:hypothetical protein
MDDPDQSKFPIGAHGFIRSISDYEMRAGSEANDSAGWRQLRRNTGSAKMTKTSPDMETTVVGLFRARGQAENARNRLKTEGVSEDRIVLKVLKETAPVPPATQLELDTLSTLAPFFAILGALGHEYVSYIRNGETALMVHGLTSDEVEDVARILRFSSRCASPLFRSAQTPLGRVDAEAKCSPHRWTDIRELERGRPAAGQACAWRLAI